MELKPRAVLPSNRVIISGRTANIVFSPVQNITPSEKSKLFPSLCKDIPPPFANSLSALSFICLLVALTLAGSYAPPFVTHYCGQMLRSVNNQFGWCICTAA